MQVEFALDGTVTKVDKGYCEFFQTSEPELLSKPFLMKIHPDELGPFCDFLQKFNADQPFGHVVHRAIVPNGTTYLTEWAGQVILDNDGQMIGTRSQGRILP